MVDLSDLSLEMAQIHQMGGSETLEAMQGERIVARDHWPDLRETIKKMSAAELRSSPTKLELGIWYVLLRITHVRKCSNVSSMPEAVCFKHERATVV
jgi:hypothetical protein